MVVREEKKLVIDFEHCMSIPTQSYFRMSVTSAALVGRGCKKYML